MEKLQTLDLEAEPSPHTRRRGATLLFCLAGGIPTLGTLGGFAGDAWWPLDLLAAMRLQYAVVLLAVVAVALLVRSWRGVLLFLPPLLINLALIAPLYQHPAPAARDAAPPLPIAKPSVYSIEHLSRPLTPQDHADARDRLDGEGEVTALRPSHARLPLRVMTFNARPNARTSEAVLDFLREAQADIIVLQELQPSAFDRLEYQIAPYRIVISDPQPGAFGIGLAERVAMRGPSRIGNTRLLELAPHAARHHAIEAELRWLDQTVMLLAVHLVPPLNARDAELHRRQIAGIGAWVKQQSHPVIVVGALQSTPWSTGIRDLISRAGLVNSQCGFGVQPNWPSSGGPLGQIPIDHILHSADLITVQRRLGPSLGSDHQSVEAAMWWLQEPPAPAAEPQDGVEKPAE